MRSTQTFTAVLALAVGLASAADKCTMKDPITVTNPQMPCETMEGDIEVDESLTGTLVLENVQEITGSLKINNATGLIGLTSTSLEKIGGTLQLESLTLLSTLELGSLTQVKEVSFAHLPQMRGPTFGTTGVTKIETITITDTFMSSTKGFNVATVDTYNINNCKKLTQFDSDLVNVTTSLIIVDNGPDMVINMPQLEMAGEIQLSDIKSFSSPALSKVENSLKFDTTNLKSYAGNNITTIGESLTFINNKMLTNISFDKLTKIGGDLTIQNNTKLIEMDGFPKLEEVDGAILLGGSFEKVELPSLEDVKGTVTVTSTTDISDFCDAFNELGDNGDAQGKVTCKSKDPKANSDSDGSGGESTDSSSDDNDDDPDSAAGALGVNAVVLGLAAIAAVAQLL